jgi:hypothetical protein|tara:strand:- start:91 stop:276 length:186 start_codon:yes stop_codon:yes gene_type:complete
LSFGQQLLSDAALADAKAPTKKESEAALKRMDRSLLTELVGQLPEVLIKDIDDGLQAVLGL